MSSSTTLAIVADFNAKTLAAMTENDPREPRIETRVCEYGQHMATLLQKDHALWKNTQAGLVWTRAQQIAPSFARALANQSVEEQTVLDEVDAFCAALGCAASSIPYLFVATWHIPDDNHGYGLLERVPKLGKRALLAAMNHRLVQQLRDFANIYVLDADTWYRGPQAYCPKMWYLAKVPYAPETFKRAICAVKSALLALSGRARKVLICDLDNTIWGGVVGDQGWEHLQLGGHDPVGEAFVDTQHQLKALTRRGVILGIVSKNTETVALEAMEQHPEMVLRTTDFAGWKINWKDKAQNIVELMQELNLGLDSAVFFDDSPVERARVKDALPEVQVLETPHDPLLYPSFLSSLACFDTPSIGQEDRDRAQMYSAQRKRNIARAQSLNIQSLEEWLIGLKVEVRPEPLSQANLPRAIQLLNKTNQMNLRTRRMSRQAFVDWSQQEDLEIWLYRVSDRFGDSGIAALASFTFEPHQAKIEDFILSCRVIGKGVEQAVTRHLIGQAKRKNVQTLTAQYIPTPKNKPCLEFLEQSGLSMPNLHHYQWDVSNDYTPSICAKIFESHHAAPLQCQAS